VGEFLDAQSVTSQLLGVLRIHPVSCFWVTMLEDPFNVKHISVGLGGRVAGQARVTLSQCSSAALHTPSFHCTISGSLVAPVA
jgi:hypothetical protein